MKLMRIMDNDNLRLWGAVAVVITVIAIIVIVILLAKISERAITLPVSIEQPVRSIDGTAGGHL